MGGQKSESRVASPFPRLPLPRAFPTRRYRPPFSIVSSILCNRRARVSGRDSPKDFPKNVPVFSQSIVAILESSDRDPVPASQPLFRFRPKSSSLTLSFFVCTAKITQLRVLFERNYNTLYPISRAHCENFVAVIVDFLFLFSNPERSVVRVVTTFHCLSNGSDSKKKYIYQRQCQ